MPRSSPNARSTKSRRPQARVGFVVLFTVVYAAVMVMRRPAGWRDPTIWAEDGKIFLAGAFDPWSDLLSLNAGQLWPLQRLVAWPISELPAQWWPLALFLASCAGVAMMMSVVLSPRAEPLLGEFWFRVATGGLLVLLPGVWEVHGNLANLHWWATIAAMLLLAMVPPSNVAWRVLEVAFIVVVALTGLGGLLLVPVAVWRLLAGPTDRAMATRSVLVFAAGAVNLTLAATYGTRAGASDPLGAAPTVVEFVHSRIGETFIVGERGLAEGYLRSDVLSVAALVLLALVALLIITDLRGPSWAWAGTGLVTVVLAMATVSPEARTGALTPYVSGRYALLALAAVVLIVMRAVALGGLARRVIGAAALVAMIPGIVIDARLPPMGPGVPAAELVAFQSCLDGAPEYADAPFCFVDIAPPSGDWRIVVWRPGVDRELALS